MRTTHQTTAGQHRPVPPRQAETLWFPVTET
jgi:hypothetical protein